MKIETTEKGGTQTSKPQLTAAMRILNFMRNECSDDTQHVNRTEGRISQKSCLKFPYMICGFKEKEHKIEKRQCREN
uniref:Uncharacterized protein n=1 Tax=Romanomermis culicivorax TaxID=13658 RepID=A0A915KAP6_ROMCU